MHSVKVKRLPLLEQIKTNRDAHRDQFLKAQAGFRERVIEELDAMLAEARQGKGLRTSVRLVAPEDHTAEYDRVIAMLEMSVDDELQIDSASFNQYVRNEWAWFQRASTINAVYSTGGKMDA